MDEIETLTIKLREQLTKNEPIDPAALQHLQEIRYANNKERISLYEKRKEEMKTHTREMTAKLSSILTDQVVKDNPDTMDKIYAMQDQYDEAAIQFPSGVEPWEDSKAATIAMALINLAHEIH